MGTTNWMLFVTKACLEFHLKLVFTRHRSCGGGITLSMAHHRVLWLENIIGSECNLYLDSKPDAA